MTDRIRKAWRVWVEGYDDHEIFYAPCRSKAVIEAIRSTDQPIKWIEVRAIRAPKYDMRLPARHALADVMTQNQTHCLLHAFGANERNPYKAGYRDYFYTNRDHPELCTLQSLGLMKPMEGDKWGEGMAYFVMTPFGKQVALSLVPEYAP